MIIYEFKTNLRNKPLEVKNICTKECTITPPCDNIYEALTIYCESGPQQGHTCNNAIFDAFILDYNKTKKNNKNVWVYLQRVNFNNAFTGSTIKQEIKISRDILEIVNESKNTREECCNLDVFLIGAPRPLENNKELPYEDTEGIYLPPIGEDSFLLEGTAGGGAHTNIVLTRVTKDSDGTVLAKPFIWQGETPINLCTGLDDPNNSDSDPIEIVR